MFVVVIFDMNLFVEFSEKCKHVILQEKTEIDKCLKRIIQSLSF